MVPGNPLSISVVVPVYSGEAYLPELVRRLHEVNNDWRVRGAPFELAEAILVDDAAIDRSADTIDRLAGEYDFVTALHLMRNFGQHSATVAGILHSSGDWVVTMDEDLQHSPGDIEALLAEAVRASSDIVYAKPTSAVHQVRSRDWGSSGFKKLMVFLTGNRNIQHFNSFRCLRGSLARAGASVCGHETYFDVALSWFTRRVSCLPVELKDLRVINSGHSGYNFWGLLTHARRLLISSQIKLIRLFGILSVGIVILSMAGALWLFIERLLFPSQIPIVGWTSLMLVILFFGGVTTFLVALVLEYMSILVLAAHGKPIFFTVDRATDRRLAEYFAAEGK